jgi:aerobic carbon-monoxide dehydrogenase small subunit
MTMVTLTVNGRTVSDDVEPRTHLADVLREHMNLTGTHLRCEQGVCGVCTILIDGQPARSCITYAVLCEGADVVTIEGLENDPTMTVLRAAFSTEHGLQCGFCTPAMLMTARDIILRLPDADEARIRRELSGNLCRCTGYMGIVRAVARAMNELRGTGRSIPAALPLGPVGTRVAKPAVTPPPDRAPVRHEAALPQPTYKPVAGLGGRQPNIHLQKSFTVPGSPDEIWGILNDVQRVVRCVPGASLTAAPVDDSATGRLTVQLGPISCSFSGEVRFIRDTTKQRGTILGFGHDRLTGSRGSGEIEYAVTAVDQAQTRVDMDVRALLTGLLAQFSRGKIVEDVFDKIIQQFTENLKMTLSGASLDDLQNADATPLRIAGVLRRVATERLTKWFARLRRRLNL